MSDEEFDVIRGSGNVFRDLKRINADVEQLKAILAAQIIKILDARSLTVRAAGEATEMAAADFSRIRKAKLGHVTIDRLMTILGRLDQKVDVRVHIVPAAGAPGPTARA
jgi:predicted XRE-type DNA-binding protein